MCSPGTAPVFYLKPFFLSCVTWNFCSLAGQQDPAPRRGGAATWTRRRRRRRRRNLQLHTHKWTTPERERERDGNIKTHMKTAGCVQWHLKSALSLLRTPGKQSVWTRKVIHRLNINKLKQVKAISELMLLLRITFKVSLRSHVSF